MQGLSRDIHKGMKVFDIAHKEIGTVEDVKFSDQNPDNPRSEAFGADHDPEPVTLIDNIAEAFLPGEQLPEALRSRMLQEGYVQLDANGLFSSDRFILAEQIQSVAGNEIVLNVSKDELLKKH